MTSRNEPDTASSRREGPAADITRRKVLSYLAAAPVLTVAARLGIDVLAPTSATAAPGPGAAPVNTPDPLDYFDVGDAVVAAARPTMPLVTLIIGENGRALFEMPRTELGQGVQTACAMLIAEELDLPLSQVDVVHSKSRPDLSLNMLTGGSATIRTFHASIPAIAAKARAQLVGTAAAQWGVAPDRLVTLDGVVYGPDGRSATYGSLTKAAAAFQGPVDVVLKRPEQYTIVGTRQIRVDALDTVTGKKVYTLDVNVPGAKPVMVKRPPTVRGTVVKVHNATTVEKMPGVIGVVQLPAGGRIVPTPPGVAVMAETFEQARAGVNALKVTWGAGPIDHESNATISEKVREAIPAFGPQIPGAQIIEAEYEWAPACMAPMETECAIADVREDRAEIWGGLQMPIIVQQAMAEELGLPVEAVVVNVQPAGGAFGRKCHWDGVQQAVHVSKALGRPAKLMYHRADDMRHTRLRAPQIHRYRASIVNGQVVAFEHRLAAESTDLRFGLGEALTATATSFPDDQSYSMGNDGFEEGILRTMVTSPYNFGATTRQRGSINLGMATGAYRSVPVQPARSTEEMMVDEIAAALGVDPYEFRLQTLRKEEACEVLRKVAEVGKWGRKMPRGWAQGIGAHMESRSFTACLVELDARNPKAPKVTKAVIAVDVGQVINPSGLAAQMEGGLAEAISLTLKAGIHIINGLPLEASYSHYHYARQADFPADLQVIVMPSKAEAPIGGAGEIGMSATSGAIANAFARATGANPRRFPINHPIDFQPVPAGMLPPPAFPKR